MLTATNVGDDYQRACDALMTSAIATDWPDLQEAVDFYRVLSRESAWRRTKNLLPVWIGLAVNGDPAPTLPLTATYQLASLAAIVLDDVIDRNRPTRLWGQWAVERGAVVSHGLAGAALRCLAHLPGNALNQIGDLLGQALLLLSAAQAQPLPLATLSADATPYFRQLFAKSGAFYGAFAKAGAQVASEAPPHWKAAFDYGVALGALIQIRNDYQDFAQDVFHQQSTLPIVLGAQQVSHPLHPSLTALLKEGVPDWQTLRPLLIEMGVEQLGEALARKYEQQARQAVAQLPRVCPPLLTLLEESL